MMMMPGEPLPPLKEGPLVAVEMAPEPPHPYPIASAPGSAWFNPVKGAVNT